MKALFGLAQIASLIVGVVALFNGRWLILIGAWVFAGVVGIIGNRFVRMVYGVSETGREALSQIPRAVALLRRGEYRSASGVTRSTVANCRLGGDKNLLAIALTLHAVALASVQDASGADAAANEAKRLTAVLHPSLAAEADVCRQVQDLVQREVHSGIPDPAHLVREFLALNDAP